MTIRFLLAPGGLIAGALLMASCAGRTVETTSRGDVMLSPTVSSLVAAWPMKQRETATMLTNKYGQPDVADDNMLVWMNRGPFVKTVLMRNAVAHNFPMPHEDYLTQTIKHRVPADKLNDLWEYDGSVWAHRTRGELSAQCDMEAFNLLALNLAHDVMTNKRSVTDARAFYAKTVMAYKGGDRSSPYTTGLIFSVEPNAADPDQPHKM